MAKVTFQAADDELRREEKAVTFRAHNKDGQIGRLVVSKGGLRWYSGKAPKKHGFLTWKDFAKRFPEIARPRSQ